MPKAKVKNNSYKQAWDALNKASNIVTFLHFSTDLDSTASCLALKYQMEKLGKKVKIYTVDPITDFQKAVFTSSQVDGIHEQDPAKISFSGFDLIVGLDFDKPTRVTRQENFKFPTNIKKVVIDHHQTNTYWGDINIVKSELTSTCSILYQLFTENNVEIDSELANILLVGILADTSVFSNLGTNPINLMFAYELVQKGADYKNVLWKMQYNQKLYLFKIHAALLQHLDVKRTGKYNYAYTYLSKNDVKEAAVPEGERLFDADVIKTLEGMNFVFSIKERVDDYYYSISLRSSTLDFDVANIAQSVFSGGGHPQAAGGIIRGPTDINMAIEYALDKIDGYLKAL